MKKNTFKRIFSAFLAFLMVFLMIPFSAIVALAAEDEAENYIDYTPFLLESVNGQAVYNAQTAELCYDFYLDARKYIDDYAGDKLNKVTDGAFTFAYNEQTYTPDSVYYSKPRDYPSCGLLTGILNFDINGVTKHIAMVAFRGSDEIEDWITDAAVITGKDGYHEGFEETAQDHYEEMKKVVSYDLGDGTLISFENYLSKMTAGDENYTMIVTGHSLGAGVAGVFTSKYLNNKNNITAKNVVTYTFASPLTCKDGHKDISKTKNVFNILNKDDIVTKVGADVAGGDRTGYDFRYKLGKYNNVSSNIKGLYSHFEIIGLIKHIIGAGKDIGNNHHMGSAYKPTMNYINDNIDKYTDTYVLYNCYNVDNNTYQRIVFSDGQLIVSGSGALSGDWTRETLIDWVRVQNRCKSLSFENCKIDEIGDYAFSGLNNITGALVLPETLVTIGDYSFFQCSGFDGVLDIPSQVVYVGVNAFCGCSSLDLIKLQRVENVDKLQLEYGAFSNCSNAQIQYPATLNHLFSTQTIWNKYTYQKNYRGQNNKTIDYVTTIACEVEDGNFHSYVAPGSCVYLNNFKYSELEVFLLENTTSVGNEALKLCKQNEYAVVNESGFIEIKEQAPTSSLTKSYGFTVVGIRDKNVNVEDFNAYVDEHGRVPYEIDTHIYFEIIDENNSVFAGGYGTEERPFIITTFDHVLNLAAEPEYYENADYYYQIIDDIDGCGMMFNGIPSFAGHLNGNEYAVYNFDMHGISTYRGFFTKIQKGAEVSNLIIGSENQQLDISSDETKRTNAYYGALVGENNGAVINCRAINVLVNPHIYYKDQRSYAYAGGLVGKNSGTITDCSVVSSTVYARAEGRNDGKRNAYASSGGLVGITTSASVITNCFVGNTTIQSYAYANGGSVNEANAYSGCGGMVGGEFSGEQGSSKLKVEGALVDNKVFNVAMQPSGEQVDKGGLYTRTNQTGYVLDSIMHEYSGATSITISSLPSKIEYFVGEELNLAGLQIVENYGEDVCVPVNGFSVKAFDNDTAGNMNVVVQWKGLETSFPITIKYIEPVALEVLVPDKTYEAGTKIDTKLLKVDGMEVKALFNNGTVKNVNFIVEPTIPDMIGTNVMSLEVVVNGNTNSYELSKNFAVNVNCRHEEVVLQGQCDATTMEYGYTGDEVCTICNTIITEGDVLPILSDEPQECVFGVWEKYDALQHVHVCIDCGEVAYALHTWDAGEITTPATHIESGEKTYTCTECGETKLEEIQPIDGHAYGEWSEYDEDNHARTCECGAVEYENHIWNEQITIPATHIAAGELTKTCTVCNVAVIETIAPLAAHNFDEWEVYDDLQHSRTCECGEVEYDTHEWDEGTVTIAPTFTAAGELTKTCATCGATKVNELSPIPIPEDQPYIVVESKNAVVGKTVTVKISLQDNPGITSMRFNVAYDSELLTLTEVEYNADFGGQSTLPESYDDLNGNAIIYWNDSLFDYYGDGLFVTLTFVVSDAAMIGETTDIVVTYAEEDIYNANETNVTFICENSTLTFVDYTAGDVNGDGIMNSKDVTRLMRYLAGWDVEVNESALDINGDGVVNTKDTTRLMRYLAGWNVEIN